MAQPVARARPSAIVLGNYLLFTLVIGALFLNIFEETAWQGLVQRHLAGCDV